MTATNGSPSPKPRPGRHHRHTKSGSSLTPGPKSHHSVNQGPQIPFNAHYIPFNSHHHNNSAARSTGSVLTPPQTPKTQGLITNTETSGKKKKKTRGRQKDSVPTTKSTPLPFSTAGSTKKQPANITESIPSEQMTPPRPSNTPVQAYAGPLFHSSPDPSALPVPKFFSKSVPATPAGTGLQAMVESEDSEDNSTSTSAEQTEESHLQKLFRADKEEKERMKMKRQSSGSSSSAEGSVETPFDRSEFNGNSIFETTRPAPRTPKPMDGIFSIDIDKPTSPVPTRLFHYTHPSPFNRTSSAPSQIHTVYTLSKEHDLKRTANLLKSHLLSPSASPKREEPSSPASAPRTQKSHLDAGLPLTPTRNNQARPDQGFVGIPSYSPDRTPRTSINDLLGSVVRQAGPPQSPLALKGSPFRRDAPLNYGPHQRNSQPKKSALASKLETARGPVTPSKSVAEMENDLRRVLNLDTYVSNAALGGGVLI